MQPRIVGIISSPSRDGNTEVLAHDALRAAAKDREEVEEISLPAHKLCRARTLEGTSQIEPYPVLYYRQLFMLVFSH